MQAAAWSGPLPPPAALERFDQIIPGGADRILKLAEEQQAHRQALEKSEQVALISQDKRGQWLGFAVILCAIGAAVGAAYLGAHWSVSVALVGVPILGMVKAIMRRD